jgi:ribonuclease VapC
VILDTSAILALVFGEPESGDFIRKINAASAVGVGAPTLAESAIVAVARLGDAGRRHVEGLVSRSGIVVIPFGQDHWSVASDAWLRFGRGRHAAALNFGDCLAYATARLADRPLLCKGEDFRQTDLQLA